MLVQLVRILSEKHLVRIDLISAAFLHPNRNRVTLAVSVKQRHYLPLICRPGRDIARHIFNLQPLKGQQQSRLMREIRTPPRTIKRIVGVTVSFFHPHRLLRQLLR